MPPGTEVKANITLVYTLRHVKSGDASYEEKDDNVIELTSAPVTKTVTLIRAREASPPSFGIWDANQDLPLNIARPGRMAVGLCFDSYSEALDFLAYTNAANAKHPDLIGDDKLGLLDPGWELLNSSELAHLEVRPRCF